MKWILILLLLSPVTAKCVSPQKPSDILFFIERNLNKNRVVYKANFDSDGTLQTKDPIKIHWIMHEENGESESLNYMEKKIAYGITCVQENSSKSVFNVKLVADETHSFILKQIAPFEAQLTTVIKGVTVKLTRLFINADNSSYWPNVKYVLIEGIELKTQQLISDKIRPGSNN
ncbi:MAG: DUF4833 domain-containing protein [Draconibacterium sp.]|nr:DUF4833 domain-containing protein [Draconibacterium sp.]